MQPYSDAKPSDREQIALYVKEIFLDHKMGADGNLIAVEKIIFGKRGAQNYERTDEVPRLKKTEPQVYDYVLPLLEGWRKNNVIAREGFPIDAWPAATKGQIKACKDLGLHVVEDVATATDATREKLGMGAIDLIARAKTFLAHKESSAQANKIAELEAAVASLTAALDEERTARKAKAGRKAKENDDG